MDVEQVGCLTMNDYEIHNEEMFRDAQLGMPRNQYEAEEQMNEQYEEAMREEMEYECKKEKLYKAADRFVRDAKYSKAQSHVIDNNFLEKVWEIMES